MIPVRLLSVTHRPSGYTAATFRAPDGRRVQHVFAPGEFTELGIARAMRFIESHRTQETPNDRHV